MPYKVLVTHTNKKGKIRINSFNITKRVKYAAKEEDKITQRKQ